MKSRNYRTSIPSAAHEQVDQRFEDGTKKSAYYDLDGEPVGFREWDEHGVLFFEYSMKRGQKHGRAYRFFANGEPMDLDTFRDGQLHGPGKQWNEKGELLITYTLVNGTGLDLWCDDTKQTLSEEHYWPKEGELGYRRNWNDDDVSVHEEYFFVNSHGYHGIWRKWASKGTLRRGYPQYYVRGNRVTKAQYVRAAAQDILLPACRKKDDQPIRDLPHEYISQRKSFDDINQQRFNSSQ
ncbi:toxin-antitoxin system YwqK family antitoxin [Schlesneria paludicola]|uniref:toxin-antitoxin system YwqK family antitoxin n=1 Tax=Schlesneria paludicola TaxID=360056 RepID=UPI0012FB26CB|nr:hypothetical protein [Schlesneria paludicola]